jgi:hypothetical protein
MKILMYLVMLLTTISAAATATPEPSEKVLKAFNETFATAENVTWNEYDNNNAQANFTVSEIQVRALYDNEGNLLETIRYYSERSLPPNILANLKKRYSAQEVFGVTEVSSATDLDYSITLRDKKYYYTVKSDAYGNLQQVGKIKRLDVK